MEPLMAPMAVGSVVSLILLTGSPPPTKGPMAVFVETRPAAAADRRPELQASADRLKAELDQLKTTLEGQLGKKRDKWPADKRSVFAAAEEAYRMALSELTYLESKDSDKTDTAADLRKEIADVAKKGYLALAESREKADLVIQVLGRYGAPKFLRGSKTVCIDVVPAGLSADRLGKVSRDWAAGAPDFFQVLHWYREGEPYMRLEASGTEKWSYVAFTVAYRLNEMVKKNYDSFKP